MHIFVFGSFSSVMVEAAGIEPASHGRSAPASTRVAGCFVSPRGGPPAARRETSPLRWSPDAPGGAERPASPQLASSGARGRGLPRLDRASRRPWPTRCWQLNVSPGVYRGLLAPRRAAQDLPCPVETFSPPPPLDSELYHRPRRLPRPVSGKIGADRPSVEAGPAARAEEVRA